MSTWKYEESRQRAKRASNSLDLGEVPFLVNCLSEEGRDVGPELRLVASAALAEYGYDVVEKAVSPVLISGSPSARAAAVRTIGETSDVRGLERVADLLEDPSDEVLLWSTLAMSKFGDLSTPHLVSALERTSGELPKAAFLADALLKVGTSNALSSLEETLKSLPPANADLLRQTLGLSRSGE